MRTPLQTRKSKAIAKEFLTDLPPLLFATPRTPLAAPIPETAKTRAFFSEKSDFIPQICDAAQRAQGAQRTDGANAPCERLPCQYFYSLPNGKRTSRERFAITRAKFRRQGSASLKIRNGPKGAHGAGGDGAPTPDAAGNRLCQNAKYKNAPAPRRPSAGNSAFRRNRRACKKNEPRERFAFGRFGNRPACATAAAMGMPFHCRRTFAYGRLMPHMQAAPPPKPDGIRRGAESGRPASCRISIPAEPTTASSG